MKKFTTLVMSMTAVFALTACGKGTKVSEEEFNKKAAAVEEHQYTEATIKYSFEEEMSMPDFTDPSKTVSDNDKDSGEIKLVNNNGKWTVKDGKDNEEYTSLVGLTLKDANFDAKDMSASYEQMAKQYGIEAKVSYYSNPLGVEVSAKGNYDQDGAKGKVDIYVYTAFDKYGYITKVEEKVNISGTATYGNNTYSSKMVVKMSATISYK